jgi:hypothetical protein
VQSEKYALILLLPNGTAAAADKLTEKAQTSAHEAWQAQGCDAQTHL